jgi:hypothetical protein
LECDFKACCISDINSGVLTQHWARPLVPQNFILI